MPRNIVDLAARSQVFRDQSLLSHAWIATPSEVLAYLQHPRSELKKIGIHLDCACEIETSLQNHDWLSGRSKSLSDDKAISVFARGEGDGRRFYRVCFYATKVGRSSPQRALLHGPDEEHRPLRPTSKFTRMRRDASQRSMRASPLHLVVHEWLAPISVEMKATKSTEEAHRIFADIVSGVGEAIAKKSALRSSLEDLAKALQQSFNPAYLTIFQNNRGEGATFHQAFVGIMYARTLCYLRSYDSHRDAIARQLTRQLAEPADSLHRFSGVHQSMSRDIVAHAVTEATIRRRHDAFFAARLSEAERLFATLDDRKDEQSGRFAAPARRLALFDPSCHGEWWFLPGLVAYAMSCMAGAKVLARTPK